MSGLRREEPGQPITLPPKQVLDVPTRPGSEHAPLKLQPTAINVKNARLQLSQGTKITRRQATSELNHASTNINSRPPDPPKEQFDLHRRETDRAHRGLRFPP